ncbi:MAG: serine/threonine-protein kinase [Byssovorax sp.]
MTSADPTPIRTASRYELLVKIGSGGTASVYIARVTGAAEFSRLVAVKRPHPHLLCDPAARRLFAAEAAVASRIHHANVLAIHDVESTADDLLLVMDYVEGVSLAELLEAGASGGPALPARVALRVALDAAAGLAAVHELDDDRGRPLGILHRDVSPQNILVGVDGTARLGDLGLARRPSSRGSEANQGLVGKLAYVAPELLDTGIASVKSEVFALGVVLWESLARRRLFRGNDEIETIERLRSLDPEPLSTAEPGLGTAFDQVISKALHKDPSKRWSSVRELAAALSAVARAADRVASSEEVSEHVRAVAATTLKRRREMLNEAGGDASSGLKSTQTAPLVVVPAKASVPVAIAIEAPIAAPIESAIEDAGADEPLPWQRGNLAAHSRIAGVAGSLALIVVIAILWITGPDEVEATAPQAASEAAAALVVHAAPPPAPMAPIVPAAVAPERAAPPIAKRPRSRVAAPARAEKRDPPPPMRIEEALGF